MKVTLAYPYTDEGGKTSQPDSTLDLPDEVATQLIRDGKARTADTKSSSKKQEG